MFLCLSACAHRPERSVASNQAVIKFGEVDFKRSLVQVFPSDSTEETISYYLYVQLKDSSGNYIDCESADFSLKNKLGTDVPFKFERVFTGRYYLNIDKEEGNHWRYLDLFLHKRPLKEEFKLQFRKPHKAHSRITKIKVTPGKLVLLLRLADRNNIPVQMPDGPEILMDGDGQIEEIKHVREGVWEFTVIYPDENQILYFSVRGLGVSLRNLYRYQHIEK